jgi:hypothetical protein
MNRTSVLLACAVLLASIALADAGRDAPVPVSKPVPAGSCHGYTWSFKAQEGEVVRVGSDANVSDAYRGDTDCNTALPVLCLRPEGQRVPEGVVVSAYSGWAGGAVAVSKPVAGTALTSRAVADGWCAKSFGAGWRVGEHHDGAGSVGWGFAAYGSVPREGRFWVAINDQRANPWDQLTRTETAATTNCPR